MRLTLVYPLERISRWDGALAARCNRVGHRAWAREAFRVASRLGDGIAWYALMLALLACFRTDAVPAVLHMIGAGLTCTLLYKWIKGKTLRARPYEVHPEVVVFAAPLDRFSFPSGHTLHAVAFTFVSAAYFPWLAWFTVPFTLIVATSRMTLGLHYPSDVLAGALLGGAIAGGSFLLVS
jgi:undecaprenyl-diphosphatase